MTTKRVFAVSAALAGLMSLSTASLASEQHSALKPDDLNSRAGTVALLNDLADCQPNPRLADKLIDVSDRSKQEDARYRASAG